MIRVHTVRLYPNKRQEALFERYLQAGRYVYNRCLEERIEAWKEEKKSLSRFDQCARLTQWRAEDERLRLVPVEVSRDAVRRVELAFNRFFRQTKSGSGKLGFPRFKSVRRWRSFSTGVPGKCCKDGAVRVSGVGAIRCRNYREIAEVKVLRVVKKAGKWFGQLTYDDGKQKPEPKPTERPIGIDLGLSSFVTLSNGESVDPPKHYRRLESRLRNANKKLSRTKKGSARRRRAIRRVACVHLRIADARSDFTHKLSKQLSERFDLIAVEDLNIAGLAKSRLSKSVMDAAWGQFINRLTYKAESAGGRVVKVDPRGTSQECSCCGTTVPKDLSVRTHECPRCGLIEDRDVNAAVNILKRGVRAVGPEFTRVESAIAGASAMPPSDPTLKREVQLALWPD